MKKFIWITMLFFTLCFSVPLLASANNDSDFDTYGVKNYEVISSQAQEVHPLMMSTFSTDSSWSTLPSKQNVDLNKEWTITFSGGTVSLDKIAGIVIEKNGAFIPVKIRLFPAANQAVVTPLENYLPNETYTVRAFLENGLRYKMTFTTKSIPSSGTSYGNTTGNVANTGLVAESNGWIYYSNSDHNNYLYKIKTDGTEKTQLNSYKSSRINIIGGWIFYRDYTNEDLRKIRINGTEDTRVSSNSPYNVTATNDGWIYLSNSPGDFYRIKQDGSNSEDLSDTYTNGSFHVIYNDAVYSSNSNSRKLTKYDLNTKMGATLTNERVSHINIENDWIYYVDIDTKAIYKIKTDGSNKQLVNSDHTQSINVQNGWIYYISDIDQSVYKIKTDGTNKVQISNSPASKLNLTSQWIYYEDPQNNKFYRMKLDGGSFQDVQ